jgi:hypothetical protein
MGGKMKMKWCKDDFRKLAHEGYSTFSTILVLLGFEKSEEEHANGSRESKDTGENLNTLWLSATSV